MKDFIIGSNVTLMVSSMAKSVKFYTETLGLKLKMRQSSHWAEIEAGNMIIGLHPKMKNKSLLLLEGIRAKDEIRTRDPDLGKVVLYQLSYFRILCFKRWFFIR